MTGPGPRTLHLHVGLPKTASTWLQGAVFPALGHLHVVAKPTTRLFRQPKDARAGHALFAGALRRAARVWDGHGDALFEEMVGPRDAWIARRDGLLITDEGIGRAANRPDLLAAHVAGLAATARRWGLERVRVLALIRRQDTWLASHYAQVSDRIAGAGQADFEAFVEGVLDPARARYELGGLLDFDALHGALVSAVGAQAVRIVPHEALRDAPEATLGDIVRWLDVPEPSRAALVRAALEGTANVRSSAGTWRLRAASHKIPGLGRRVVLPDRIAPARTIALRPETSAAVLEAFAPGNRRLAAALDLPLGRWGYFGDG